MQEIEKFPLPPAFNDLTLNEQEEILKIKKVIIFIESEDFSNAEKMFNNSPDFKENIIELFLISRLREIIETESEHNINILNFYLQNGISPDAIITSKSYKYGFYLEEAPILFHAIRNNNTSAVKLLLENDYNKLDVNTKYKDVNQYPIEDALKVGNADIIQMLISHGAKLDILNKDSHIFDFVTTYKTSDYKPIEIHSPGLVSNFIGNIYDYFGYKHESVEPYLKLTDNAGIIHHYNLLTGEESLINNLASEI